jgi:thiosulfate/3-mercaptopyruvate sulfurtransferase
MTAENEFVHPEFLVDASWVEDHLDAPDVVVVDADVKSAYNRGHIPGAVLIPDNYAKDPNSGRVHVMTPYRFATMCQNMGIGDRTLVVAYDNSLSLYAARLWWVLNYYGHHSVKILDGGWRRWVTEGRAISFGQPKQPPEVEFTSRADESLRVMMDELKSSSRSNVVVWDVRSSEEYDGSNNRGNRRAGHIPGAIHLEWLRLMDQDTHRFKPSEEIQSVVTGMGISPDKQVHIY